ncbi:MAG TPA: phage tail protein [Rhodoferax sp.]
MAIKIGVNGSMDRIIADLGRVKSGVLDKAVTLAINRVGEMAITQASREMRADGYNFTATEIKSAFTQRKATAGSYTTTLKVRRKTKSLMNFRPRESKAGVTVLIHGSPKLIKGAFIAQRLNGLTGVFVEDKSAGKIVLRRQKQYKRGSKGGWHSVPSRKLYGPSVGGAYANRRIQDVMIRLMGDTFEKRLTHEVKRLIG